MAKTYGTSSFRQAYLVPSLKHIGTIRTEGITAVGTNQISQPEKQTNKKYTHVKQPGFEYSESALLFSVPQ